MKFLPADQKEAPATKEEEVECPYCTQGVRMVKLYRVLMHPEVPRDGWEYPEPREGWNEEPVTCVVCSGKGWVKAWEKKKKPIPTRMVKEKAEVCHECGGDELVMKVQRRRGAARTFTGPLVGLCVLCRAKLVGSWRYPRQEKKTELKVVSGGLS